MLCQILAPELDLVPLSVSGEVELVWNGVQQVGSDSPQLRAITIVLVLIEWIIIWIRQHHFQDRF